MTISGKAALITGAASGIGRAIAEVFAGAGARVCIADISIDAAQQAAAQIAATYDVKACAVEMDVSDESQVSAGFDAMAAQLGSVDILVSNAGIQIISPLVDLKYEDWKRLMAIHADGAFLTTRAAMRKMIAQGNGGAVIYMGSVHSHQASPLKAPYVTAKHGLLGLAKVVAKEGAEHRIRANVICPGFVRTPLVDKQIPEQARTLGITEAEVVKNVMLKETVDGEFTTAHDVAQTALFLAGFDTAALTGQSITVSHGWHMQ
ncbi:3-hydroxybutyrate dehydrogenase [Massilia sp. PWRC2]|uniref:3-hydroxybutyrate dehydrogenase n=1 Tax=Massilia sp. PWRC2 TaxID=2804626 RepID=UPI003CED8C80